VLWNDESDPAVLIRREDDANVEKRRAYSLSIPRRCLQVGAAGEPLAPREAVIFAR